MLKSHVSLNGLKSKLSGQGSTSGTLLWHLMKTPQLSGSGNTPSGSLYRWTLTSSPEPTVKKGLKINGKKSSYLLNTHPTCVLYTNLVYKSSIYKDEIARKNLIPENYSRELYKPCNGVSGSRIHKASHTLKRIVTWCLNHLPQRPTFTIEKYQCLKVSFSSQVQLNEPSLAVIVNL